jgi:hypothetical protein
MSDSTAFREPLDMREQIARIDRNLAETQKLLAEARKFNRDPWFLIAGAIIAAIASRLPEILHAFGLHTT